jgi:hypothetical protein
MNIIDGAIPEKIFIDCVSAAETEKNYGVLHKAGDGSFGFKYNWTLFDPQNGLDSMDRRFQALWDCVRLHVPDGYSLHRAYVNAHTSGVEDSIHQDDIDVAEGKTIIVYLCTAWYAEWFGQTVFFENMDRGSMNEITKSVIPRPNRIVIFDKNIPHCVSPLSRRFAGIRLTCMFKVKKDEC